jgi:hypothetical protein
MEIISNNLHIRNRRKAKQTNADTSTWWKINKPFKLFTKTCQGNGRTQSEQY